MKKTILLTILLSFTLFATACTENQRAKNFGGEMTVKLPPKKKLVMASFKNDDLWYLLRDAKQGETPESYVMIEDSSYGVMTGKVIFVEQ